MQHIFYEPSRNIQLKFLTIIRIYQVVQYNPVPLTIKKVIHHTTTHWSLANQTCILWDKTFTNVSLYHHNILTSRVFLFNSASSLFNCFLLFFSHGIALVHWRPWRRGGRRETRRCLHRKITFSGSRRAFVLRYGVVYFSLTLCRPRSLGSNPCREGTKYFGFNI